MEMKPYSTRTVVATLPKTKVLISAEPLVLGIDAGATKTTAAIGNATTVLATGQSGAGNLHSASEKEVAEHINDALRRALHGMKRPVINFMHIVIGMAGIDSPQDQIRAERLLIKTLRPWCTPRTSLAVMNDIHIVRRSGSEQPFGVALIAGTGSHCFGVNADGDVAYAGGLEYILSDEGSGYDIGLKVLRAAVRSADGRIPHTSLQEAALQHFKVRSIRALEPLVYHSNRFGKQVIAKLAKLVDSAAVSGDWRAQEIMEETIKELVAHVHAVVQRLALTDVAFDLVLVGGVFDITAVPFLQRFKRAVKKITPKAHIIRPKHPPVWGAVRLAQDKL